jgi:triacylglycerol esterase/lipase EstA (alpha/beta hydrolase family)
MRQILNISRIAILLLVCSSISAQITSDIILPKQLTETKNQQIEPANDELITLNFQSLLASYSDEDLLYIEDASPNLPLDDRTPLLLVHGWSFDGKPAAPGGGYWNNFINYLLNDPELRNFYKPYYVKYWSNAVPVQNLGQLLRDKVEQAGFNNKEIAIIAHSMGGLVSRSFMNENSYTTGKYIDKKCGENVKLLVTLSSPHHGSPMANGPARNDKVNFLLQLTMSLVEENAFKETKYNEVNRSDLRWDNYDNLLNYTKYPNEKNDWLVNLNSNTTYDSKLICYAGTVTGKLLLSINTVEEQYEVGSYLMKQAFGFDNDGIVPIKSSTFDGHTPKRIRRFSEYNHADINIGKDGNDELFNSLKEDLLDVTAPIITWPTAQNLYLKHSQQRNITWKNPSSVSLVDISFSADSGKTFTQIAQNIKASAASYQWNIPDTNATYCFVKLTNPANERNSSMSEYPFSIYHNKISFSNPVVNSYFVPNKSNLIKWEQEGLGSNVEIIYIDKKNNTEKVIASTTPTQAGDNTFTWNPDNMIEPSDSTFISIQLLGLEEKYADNEDYTFTSDQFLFLDEPSVTVTAPGSNPIDQFGISGEKLYIDSLYNIQWIAEGDIKYVYIKLCDSTKKTLLTISRQVNTPGIHSAGSFNWKVPAKYGDGFYISFVAETFDKNTIDTVYSFPFRINREAEVISPVNGSKDVTFVPYFQLRTLSKATNYKVELKDSSTNGELYSKEFEASNSLINIPQTIENELYAGSSYQLTAQAFFDTIPSYKSLQYFAVKKSKPEIFSIIKPEQADTTEGNELLIVWNHAVGSTGYELQITNKDNLLFDGSFAKTDTLTVATLGNPGIPDTLLVTITAKNDFGETTSESYFFKKNRTGIEYLERNENPLELSFYPNPVDHKATIEFNIVSDQFVSLSVYSITGQKIVDLINSKMGNGKHTITWDTKNNPSTIKKGVYIMKLATETSSTAKTLVIK